MRSVEHEFVNAPIPDKRLQRRLTKIAESAATDPAATFPHMAASDGELEAIYRFLNNARVTPESILEPHRRATFARANECSTVVAVHDTTEFEHDGEAAEELGYLATGQRGFFGHFSLLLGARAEPLGIAAMKLLFRNTPPSKRGQGSKKKQSGFETAKIANRERERWLEGVESVEHGLAEPERALHVMDRGADGYELFSAMKARGSRFVIRMRHMTDRVAAASETDELWGDLGAVVAAARYVCQREVLLSRRRPSSIPNKTYGPRKQRLATLHIEASPLILRRGRHLPSTKFPSEQSLNLVCVREVNVPGGEEPVEWWLVTTEPIGTQAEVETVVDAYRARWKIEEYFKALKTGCGWRDRQLESREGLVNTLALLVPIAWHLLAIRDVARISPDAPATTVFTRRHLKVLRAMSKRPISEEATVTEALLAVAGQGGHLKRNGDPGWQTLGRGLEKLWWATFGYNLALAESGSRR